MRIFLAGASGVIGQRLIPLLVRASHVVAGTTRSAAKAWGSFGVTVNALAPAVETPGADRFREFVGPEGAAMMKQRLPESMPVPSTLGLGLLGDPIQDLGPVMVFLASVGSRFVTGQLLAVSGGSMMLGA